LLSIFKYVETSRKVFRTFDGKIIVEVLVSEKHKGLEEFLTKLNISPSVVIPVLNESESLPELYSKLKGSMDKLKKKYEIIFIDDGSADNSFEILKEIHLKDSRVKVIKFRKNFGQTVAISAGFDHAKGNVIVTMDSDLQNDPGDISKLLQKMDEGFDVVSGWRADRKDPFTKKIPLDVL